MSKKEKAAELARMAGGLAMELMYPSRCPLCDQLRPALRLRSVFQWAKQPAAERREVALPELRPALRPEPVCADCREKLPWVREPACMRCGKPVGSPEAEFCRDCLRTSHLFDQGRAAFTYSGAMRRSVYRMKALNRRDYLDFYADAMVRAGRRYLDAWRPEVIVPVPMHWKKRAARGYNQSELLAVRVSRLTGIPFDRKLLYCIRYTGVQKELGREERLRNLRGSFEARRLEKGRRYEQYDGRSGAPSSVLLIDDVYTTGSTMDEAARALRAVGVRHIFFLVLCTGATERDRIMPRSIAD
ncbi:MAG: ComF family protein [Clostridiales bacterium]|nr:ComF family protein [Clostridiales bacterium]